MREILQNDLTGLGEELAGEARLKEKGASESWIWGWTFRVTFLSFLLTQTLRFYTISSYNRCLGDEVMIFPLEEPLGEGCQNVRPVLSVGERPPSSV